MRRTSPGPTVLLLGASGFIGQSILQSIVADGETNLRVLTRRPTPLLRDSEVSIYAGDITDRSTLEEATPGVDVIVNAASYIGSDPLKAAQVNHEGTRNLLEIGTRFGVSRFVQLSTTSVYGTGPHRGESETSLPYAPESVTSCSRANAEQLVLEAGGSVLRTGLIYGPGDKWFIPSMIRMATILGGPIGCGESKLSVIDVEHLGRLVTGLLSTEARTDGPFHAAEPAPVSVGRILRHIEDCVTGSRWPARTDPADSLGLLIKSGFTDHQAALLSQDHWYQSDRLWKIAELEPPTFKISTDAAIWYRRLLSDKSIDRDQECARLR